MTQITLNEWVSSFDDKPMNEGIKRVINRKGVFVIEWQ